MIVPSTALAIEPALYRRDGWAGISIWYANEYAGFSRDGRTFAHCLRSTCELLGAAPEVLHGTFAGSEDGEYGQADAEMFGRLAARGFDVDGRDVVDGPRSGSAIASGAFAYADRVVLVWAHDLDLEGTCPRCALSVLLRDVRTGSAIEIARFEGTGEMLLTAALVSPDGARLGLVADDIQTQRGVLIDVHAAVAQLLAETDAVESARSR